MRVKKNPRRLRLLILNGALVLLCLSCLLGARFVATRLQTLHAAERWRGESEMVFAQIACYLPEGEGITPGTIESYHETLDQKFIDASLEAPEGGRLYTDAACAARPLTFSSDHGSATVQALGVLGDFFRVHPYELRCGSYLSPDDLMLDRVVLDESAAWQLFGGLDVAGLTVYLGDYPFYVAGVVRRESDFASKAAWDQTAGVFMSYQALKSYLGEDADLELCSYEIVVPEILSGYGENMVRESFPLGRGDLVNNSARYSLKHLWSVARDFGKRSMRLKSILYPYWENAARMTEDYLSLLLAQAVIFGLCPFICLVVLVIQGLKRGGHWAGKKIPQTVEDAVEHHRRKAWDKKHPAEESEEVPEA